MSYEFNPESQLFEFPNPYRLENIAAFVVGTAALAASLYLMMQVRQHLSEALNVRSASVFLISIALLVFAIGIIARSFGQLRFYFGRNRPESLAKLVANGEDGDTDLAAHYRETLRQNALTYPEPRGPLNGLLYAWVPQLIFAPRTVRGAAQAHFFQCLALLAVLLSFVVCWITHADPAARAWIGLIYGGYAWARIARPSLGAGQARLGISGLVLLIVLAVLGPVLLQSVARVLPVLPGFDVNLEVLIVLLVALCGCVIFGLALHKQLRPAPTAIGAARCAHTLSMNAHPNKLIEELDRIMMQRWFHGIPNRRYTRKSPQVTERRGQFSADLFEETQPRPINERTTLTMADALAAPKYRWLAVLTVFATLILLAGCTTAVATGLAIMHAAPFSSPLTLTLGFGATGLYCLRTAHLLWGRFDFVSELIWVEINGSYESANVHVGTPLAAPMQTAKDVVNVESMTLRVWVSEIDTVVFGKDAVRQLVGMRGLPALADELGHTLKQFGENCSMVVAPSSNTDLQRAHSVGILNGVLNAGQNDHGAALADALQRSLEQSDARSHSGSNAPQSADGVAATATPNGREAAAKRPAFCSHCGFALHGGARFCGGCGTALS